MEIKWMLKIFILFSLQLVFINCVDRKNFKTCEQSSFCRRCRRVKPGNCSYELQLDTLTKSKSDMSVKAEILNIDNGVRFIMGFYMLKQDTFRIQIDQVSPLKARYREKFSLDGEPKQERLKITDRMNKSATIVSGKNKAVIYGTPFKIDIYHDGHLSVTVNERGLFRFEHQRKKPEQKYEVLDGDSENSLPLVDEEPGTWEENFKSHHDTKPFGPNAVALDFSFPGAEQVYGLPEHADSLALKSTKKTDPYRLYNLDVFEYELNNPMALYVAIPLLISHSVSKTVGVFWLNPSETWVDISGNSQDDSSFMNFITSTTKLAQVDAHFMSETGIIDVFILLGPKPYDVFFQYSRLTGTAPIPPLFSLGYHQSRWNYMSQTEISTINNEFDQHDIPMDVMWLDIEYTDNKMYFTWDSLKFSTPYDMIKNLTSVGRKLVTIIDPHIKKVAGYNLHDEAEASGYFVKNKDGNIYEGWCWPGPSNYLDVLNEAARDYYASFYDFNKFISTEDVFIWNDMNEPSVFNGPELTMLKDCIHHGNWEHREVHNIYGQLFVMATYKGLLERYNFENKSFIRRPFILSRSGFAGIQRYAAVWTGDNSAEWSHLAISVPMCLSLAISGVSFCGADVGGFFGNPDSELFTRWYQTGAFLPFFRGHSHIDTQRREPWMYGSETTCLVREAIRKRYSLLQFWYTQFYIHNRTGEPVIRPIWVEFPSEREAFTIDNQFLIGNSTLVRPVTEPGVNKIPVYFPGFSEIWYDFDSYEPITTNGLQNIPVNLKKIPFYIRGGAIIAIKARVRRSSVLMQKDPYKLIVALTHNGTAKGNLYIDDGETFQHIHNNRSILLQFVFANNQLTSKNVLEGHYYDTKSWLEKVIILGMEYKIKKAQAKSSSKNDKLCDLDTHYDDDKKTLTIKKPELKMDEEWKILLK